MQVHTDASLKFQLKCKEKEKKVKAAVEKHGNRNHFEFSKFSHSFVLLEVSLFVHLKIQRYSNLPNDSRHTIVNFCNF